MVEVDYKHLLPIIKNKDVDRYFVLLGIIVLLSLGSVSYTHLKYDFRGPQIILGRGLIYEENSSINVGIVLDSKSCLLYTSRCV